MQGLILRRLSPQDGSAVSRFLLSQPDAYMTHFIPFPFDEDSLTARLGMAIRDLFLGVFWEGEFVAFFMLRGWDEGYEVPAYGAAVAHAWQGKGLGKWTLDTSRLLAGLRGATRLMLKVHPENRNAKRLYESYGFQRTGFDDRNGNLIYQLSLEGPR